MALTAVPLGLAGQVFRCAMPFSAYDRAGQGLDAMHAVGVSVVVVLSEPEETLLHAGRDLRQLYREEGFEVIDFPIRDLGVAQDDTFRELVGQVLDHLRGGRHVAVHCLAGRGRAGTLLACLARATLGHGADEAVAWVRRYVPGAVETAAQIALIARLACPLDDPPSRSQPDTRA